MPAKKTTKKVAKKAAKKVAVKKIAKKAAKKDAQKAAPTKAEEKKVPSLEAIQEAAYFNYLKRRESGKPGGPMDDWAAAMKQLGL